MPERKFDDFDEFASDYRRIHTENVKISGADSYYFAEMKVKLLTGLEEQESSLRILDLGCGDGTTEVFMNRYFPNWNIEAIDISEAGIQEAKNKKLPKVTFNTYNGSNIPFEDDHFDIVFMAGVLHHVGFSFHKKIMEEVFRVLKGNGRLYLFEHNPINPLTRYLVRTCVFDKDARLLKNSYTRQLLGYYAPSSVKTKFIIFFPRISFFKLLLPLEKWLTWLPFGGQYFIRAVKAIKG